jgi:hypothetical protein
MERIRRKKIYYIPGMISLILLMPFFVRQSKREIKSKSLYAIKTTWADANAFKRNKKWSSGLFGMTLPKRRYEEFVFTGENQLDKIKLDFAHIRVREITQQKDSICGIHFKFDRNAEYWTFIKTLDILKFEKAKHFWPVDHDIWFFYTPPEMRDTIKNDFVYECGCCDFVVPRISWWKNIQNRFGQIWYNSWEIILAFLGFILSITIIKRLNNGR